MPDGKEIDVVAVKGGRLYYERQGAGPSLLFIAGSTGDAGNVTRAADLLADEFRVVTYDRRGNHPGAWVGTCGRFRCQRRWPDRARSDDQAPSLVSTGILQEPSIFSVLSDAMVALAPRRALIEEVLKTTGPREAIEALMRYLNDDRVLAAIPPDVLDRMLSNADTILNIESPGFAGWRPRNEDLATLRVPVVLVIARETLPVYGEVMGWLARELKVEPIAVPGRDAFYYYRPQDLADLLRPILRRVHTS